MQTVQANPVIPYIEGDGIGPDVTKAMILVVNKAVQVAYQDQRCLQWLEVYAGAKAEAIYGPGMVLPPETLAAIRQHKVAIKGPLATPVGGGIRSVNVALRQELDLYVCLRPVRYFAGTPSPVRHPELVNMVIFRENTEDIYAGIEWPAGDPQGIQLINYLQTQLGVKNLRFTADCGLGIKPISKAGSERLLRQAFQYAIDHDRTAVTIVHKGNIMKFTEGAFKQWGYALAEREFGAVPSPNEAGSYVFTNPKTGRNIIVNDVIADAFLQQILLRPEYYQVIATMNLNGDYISDALAAQVGGIGMAPGANLNDELAVFEATHGTAPKYAGTDKSNPSSLILSAEMMLRHLGWNEAADLIIKSLELAISNQQVTYDLARLLPKQVEPQSCSGFANCLANYIEQSFA